MANVDFGHTSPLATLPVGGQVEFVAATLPAFGSSSTNPAVAARGS
jgi:muramoyltetrapeptide carboxypeptidase LdcA involved in peptidoglycan recycling